MSELANQKLHPTIPTDVSPSPHLPKHSCPPSPLHSCKGSSAVPHEGSCPLRGTAALPCSCPVDRLPHNAQLPTPPPPPAAPLRPSGPPSSRWARASGHPQCPLLRCRAPRCPHQAARSHRRLHTEASRHTKRQQGSHRTARFGSRPGPYHHTAWPYTSPGPENHTLDKREHESWGI